MLIESKILDTDGGQIYYEVRKGSPFVVFLHGIAANHTVFNHARDRFHELGMGSLSLDLRGHGKSTFFSNEASYSLAAFASDLEEIIKAENIESVSLIGHSMGSMIAQKYAVDHPDKVDALILVSASYDFKKTYKQTFLTKAGIRLFSLLDSVLIFYNTFFGLWFFNRSSYYPDFSEKKFQNMHIFVRHLELHRKQSSPAIKAMHAATRAILKWNTTSFLPALQVPTQVIHGAVDEIIPIKVARELCYALPNCKNFTIIPHGRHSVVFQLPEAVTSAMEKFLFTDVYSKS